LAYASVLFAIFLVAARFAGKQAASLLGRSARLRANRTFLRHIVSWIVGSIGILLALGVMGFHGIAASLLATGGVAAIVLGFAFREIGENILAGLFLTFSRPFEPGDLIKTGDLTGIVQSIELRHIHIRTPEASDVFVPNALIFREPLHNYTRDGLRRPAFTIGVAYHDEPNSVLDLLRRAAAAVAGVLADPQPTVMLKGFVAHYIEYEIFFWIDENKTERGLDAIENDVKVNCWHALRDAGMTFSTDTICDHDNPHAPHAETAALD
jgi:small conductance mechanosensitive channel